jgi:hypothetical protein
LTETALKEHVSYFYFKSFWFCKIEELLCNNNR